MIVEYIFTLACKKHAWGVLVAMCCICFSCSDGVKVVTKFPSTKVLSGNYIEQLDSIPTAYSVTKVADKYVFGIKKDKYLFCVYNEDLLFQYKMMRRGNGHDEWLAPKATGQIVEMDDKKYATFLERERNILYAVDMACPTSSPIKIEDFRNTNLYGLTALYKADENTYIGIVLQESSKLCTYNTDTRKFSVLQPQAMSSQLFNPVPFYLSQASSTYNDKQKTIAIAYFNFPRISILSVDGTKDITLQIGTHMPQYTDQTAMDPHFYCLDICSTDDYVYVLYDAPDAPNGMNILAFDWKGNPIANYSVPRLSCFTIDEKNRRFIAQAEDESDGAWLEINYYTEDDDK